MCLRKLSYNSTLIQNPGVNLSRHSPVVLTAASSCHGQEKDLRKLPLQNTNPCSSQPGKLEPPRSRLPEAQEARKTLRGTLRATLAGSWKPEAQEGPPATLQSLQILRGGRIGRCLCAWVRQGLSNLRGLGLVGGSGRMWMWGCGLRPPSLRGGPRSGSLAWTPPQLGCSMADSGSRTSWCR